MPLAVSFYDKNLLLSEIFIEWIQRNAIKLIQLLKGQYAIVYIPITLGLLFLDGFEIL